MNYEISGKKRIAWIDVAKYIGIFLVILGHMESYTVAQEHIPYLYLKNIIFAFHMPLFFFLSGYTVKKRKFFETLKKYSFSLLVPYVFFYFISWLYFILNNIRYKIFDINILLIRPMIGMFWGFNTPFCTMVNTPIWFLLDLFFCNILLSIISEKKLLRYVQLVIVLLISFFLSYFKYELPLSISPVPVSFIFFYANAYIGIFIVYIISSYFKMTKSMQFLGSNTIVVLGIHILMISLCNKIITRFPYIYTYIIFSILILYMCYIPIILFTKFVPFFIGRKK